MTIQMKIFRDKIQKMFYFVLKWREAEETIENDSIVFFIQTEVWDKQKIKSYEASKEITPNQSLSLYYSRKHDNRI